MSKHKKQHYIPKCYLKAWCDSNCPPKQTPYVWVFDRNSKTGKRKSPDNIFHETDMYTIWDEEGNRNLEIENGLSGLETRFSSIRISKLDNYRELDHTDKLLLTEFIAAMHTRTPSRLDNMSNQWKRPLEKMNRLAKQMRNASKKEKENLSRVSSFTSYSSSGSFTHKQVKEMVEDPVKSLLRPMINAEARLIANLDLSIRCTKSSPGFITSDSPCVWYDPKGYTRPPAMQGPALKYETIQITFPVSPSKCIILNRQGITGYHDITEDEVRDLNRRTRFFSSEYFVVNQNYTDDIWLDPGVIPGDSWEKQQSKKEANKPINSDS